MCIQEFAEGVPSNERADVVMTYLTRMEDDNLIVLDPMTYEVKKHPVPEEHERIAAKFRFWLSEELRQLLARNEWREEQRREERRHQEKMELQLKKQQEADSHLNNDTEDKASSADATTNTKKDVLAKAAASTTSTDLESKEADDPINREGADQE